MRGAALFIRSPAVQVEMPPNLVLFVPTPTERYYREFGSLSPTFLCAILLSFLTLSLCRPGPWRRHAEIVFHQAF